MRRSDFDVQVGNRLRMARFRAKLTPAELAKMVGSDEAEIESWETGSSVIYFDEMAVGRWASRRTTCWAGGRAD